jgi:hypothetical protein
MWLSTFWHCALECSYQHFGTVPWNVNTNILALCLGMWLPIFWHCALDCGHQHFGTVPWNVDTNILALCLEMCLPKFWHCVLECSYQHFGTVPWNVDTNILALCLGLWPPTFWHCALECGYEHFGTVPWNVATNISKEHVIADSRTVICAFGRIYSSMYPPPQILVIWYLLVHEVLTQTTAKCLHSEGHNNRHFEEGILLPINCKLQQNEFKSNCREKLLDWL